MRGPDDEGRPPDEGPGRTTGPRGTAEQAGRDDVAVVVTTFDQARFLGEALASVAGQTHAPAEIIVVDDGSADDPAAVVAGRPGVRLLRQDNRGLSAARNTGLLAARSRYVLFLDADDLLTPVAVAAGLACFDRFPEAAFVYGAHRRVDATGRPLGPRRFSPVGGDPHADLLRGNLVAMHATVLYRRAALLEIGGFDEKLRGGEDYDVYLRLSRRRPVASHPVETALYRWHGANMSADARRMLRTAQRIHRRHRPARAEADRRRAWRAGRRNWRTYYAWEVIHGAGAGGRSRLAAARAGAALAPSLIARLAARRALRRAAGLVPASMARHLPGGRPPVGRVRLGDLGRPEPVSRDFGWDRGRPIDRYYIEAFLRDATADIRGCVLEVGDATYSGMFGEDRIETQDVLHVHSGNAAATLVGDLGIPGVLPPTAFDCIVLTQTLQLVYDLRTAVSQLHAALRPGGVLLLTVPGISQLDRGEWGATWYWSFTPEAVRRLLAECFGEEAVHVDGHGNAFAATAFLQGLALEEVDPRRLDVRDPAYPVLVSARAQKLPGTGLTPEDRPG